MAEALATPTFHDHERIPFNFGGQRAFGGIGLYDYGARFYDPLLGRFISPDTVYDGGLADPQGLNRYSYVYNRPTFLVDPSGFAPGFQWDQNDKKTKNNSSQCITNPAGCSSPPPLLEKDSDSLVVAPAQVDVTSGGMLTAKGSGLRQKIRDAGDKIGMALGGCKGLLAILCSETARKTVEQAQQAAANNQSAITTPNELIAAAGKFEKLKGGVLQGEVTGNATEIFRGLTQGAKQLGNNLYELKDQTIVKLYNSSTTGEPTIQINTQDKIYKVRINP